MALFGWRKKTHDDQDHDSAAAQRHQADIPEEPEQPVDEAWQRLETAIESHPLFRLVTFDGLYWIDPFNGELVSAPFDLEDTVRSHFQEHDHWRGSRTRSAVQLYSQRWLRWLEEELDNDPRFQLFTDDGQWFNPHSKEASESISSEMLDRRGHFIKRIAQELAQSPEASPHEMDSLEELEVILGRRAPPPKQEDEPGQKSGIRLAQSALPGNSTTRYPAVDPNQPPPGTAAYVPPGAGHAVPPGHGSSAYYPAQSPVAPQPTPTAGGSSQVYAPNDIPALAAAFPSQAQALVANAVRDVQQAHALSEQDLQQRLQAQVAPNPLPQDATALIECIAELKHSLDQERARNQGPSNQELYNCLISLRDDVGSGQHRRDGGEASHDRPPVVSQKDLGSDAINQLVSSLRSISLVAERIVQDDSRAITARSPRDDDELDQIFPAPDGGPPEGPVTAHEGVDLDAELEETLADDEADDAEDQDHREDMERAISVQGHLLGGIPALKGVELALEYQPFSSIGGDFYQVFKLSEDRFFFMVGDVSGHGVQAALIVSSIVNSLKIILRRAADMELTEIICELNDYMRECLPSGKFFTSFSGIIDTSQPEAVKLECITSGHHPTICLNPREAEPIREIGRSGMGIGLVRSEIFSKQVRSDRYILNRGDVLAVYTDGITETMDENGDELGEMLVRCSFFNHLDKPPAEQIQAVLRDIAEESDGVVNDDLTVMVIRIL
ncbi:MAG: hypothetical protein EA401_11320 [Planctomycetota bacterium]|nr:MAG: hypothetical protein EA401_11320 [Planctomycetota bacterium]